MTLVADRGVQRAGPSTIASYESSLASRSFRTSGHPLRDLRRIHLQEWLGHLRKVGYSNSTIHIAKTAAGMVLASAADSDIIASNPMVDSGSPRGPARPARRSPPSRWSSSPMPWAVWRPFLLVLAYCGLRPGEAIALRGAISTISVG